MLAEITGYERYATEVELSNFLEVKEFKASRNLGTTTQTATGMSGPWGARWCTTEKKEMEVGRREREEKDRKLWEMKNRKEQREEEEKEQQQQRWRKKKKRINNNNNREGK